MASARLDTPLSLLHASERDHRAPWVNCGSSCPLSVGGVLGGVAAAEPERRLLEPFELGKTRDAKAEPAKHRIDSGSVAERDHERSEPGHVINLDRASAVC